MLTVDTLIEETLPGLWGYYIRKTSSTKWIHLFDVEAPNAWAAQDEILRMETKRLGEAKPNPLPEDFAGRSRPY